MGIKAMDAKDLKEKIEQLLQAWQANGIPTRQGFAAEAQALARWRDTRGIAGLWPFPPVMVTATIDDGWGQGLELIHRFADAVGLHVVSLGLLQPPETVIEACHRYRPDLLGLTVVQLDAEEDLAEIAKNLPERTKIVAGGPAFKADPDFARRTGVSFVAAHAAAFLGYLLDFQP
jgi:methylmalonyl-CoA mutase cobalamin-binding subunit